MHKFVIVLIDTHIIDIRNEVARLLTPYDDNIEVEPHKIYFTKEMIERSEHQFGITEAQDRSTLAKYIGSQGFWKKAGVNADEKGIYYVGTANPLGKWDHWSFFHGDKMLGHAKWQTCKEEHSLIPPEQREIICNSCLVTQLIDTVSPSAVITPNGEWEEIENPGTSPSTEPLLPTTGKMRLTALLDRNSDCLAVGIDYHY